MTNGNDSKVRELEELSDSRTLGAMLSSNNLDNIKLALGILNNHRGGTDVMQPVNDLVIKLLDTVTNLYQRLENTQYGSLGEVDAIKDTIHSIQDMVVVFLKDTWIDPISLQAEHMLSKRIAELQQEQVNEDELNAAL